jgi:adenine-specific DNA-methyltransferase
MRSENYIDELTKLLKTDKRLLVENKLNKNKVAELAHKYDSELIYLLTGNKAMRRLFFISIKNDVLVFNTDKFIQFINNKEFLPDSFTAYKNKVGLATGTELLSEKKEVVLNWAYKDCVLEGGQDKEDAKRDEIFHNEVLAPDQIDRLLDQKVLTDFKRYDKDGEQVVKEVRDNDNLILRGNNLLALHSLKKRYAGKVKLIYIDPPYNTGNDSFGYNDRFNHSTWLTFMKNRLEAAKTMLRNDGAIFISIDAKEIAYTMVLMDEIYGKDNFRNLVAIRRSAISGAKVINPGVVNVSEYLLVYSRSANWTFNRTYATKERDTRYNLFIQNYEDSYTGWKFIPLTQAFADSLGIIKTQLKNHFAGDYSSALDKFALDNVEKVVQFASLDESSVSERAVSAKKESISNGGKVVKLERDKFEPYFLFNGKVILFYKDRVRVIDGVVTPVEPTSDIWTDVLPNDIHNEGGVSLRKGKKPEKLLSRIIEIATDKGDLVLDYHLGSGTTAAVAHKMGRNYIGIEQLDYGDNDPTIRLNKVIAGEDRGISKTVGWAGGGSFVYCRMMDLGNSFIQKIKSANSEKKLVKLVEQAKKSSFLSYKVDPEKINPGCNDFKGLSVAHKQQLLLELVDQNHLYVNYSEIDDIDYGVSAEDKKLNKQFYGK